MNGHGSSFNAFTFPRVADELKITARTGACESLCAGIDVFPGWFDATVFAGYDGAGSWEDVAVKW
ncbi:MAG TPA: hypothetical protein VH092_29915 [Urbifossiella sp.]|jgi:hypothetical protein|nr:hypothetical protein [Urbifossiella sp.]